MCSCVIICICKRKGYGIVLLFNRTPANFYLLVLLYLRMARWRVLCVYTKHLQIDSIVGFHHFPIYILFSLKLFIYNNRFMLSLKSLSLIHKDSFQFQFQLERYIKTSLLFFSTLLDLCYTDTHTSI